MRQALIVLALLAVVMIIGFGVYHLGEYQSRRLENHMRRVADEVADSILTDWGVEYPCPPCPDYCSELKRLRKENWRLEYEKWELHCKLTRLQVPVDTLYRMPPGRWYKCNLGFLGAGEPDSMTVWPDSVFILSDPAGEE